MLKLVTFASAVASAYSLASCRNEPGRGYPLGGGEGVGSNSSFLDIYLWDAFGDGWGTAHFVARNPAGDVTPLQATCDKNAYHVQLNPCAQHANIPAQDGDYFLTLVNSVEGKPAFFWEMFWTVQVLKPDGSEASFIYTGGYNTTMVWNFKTDTDTWTLKWSEGLITDFDCDGCTGGKCKPKPKPDGKGKGDTKGDGKGDTKGGDGSDTSDTSSSSSSEEGSKKKKPYGPRAVNLEVVMHSESELGWTDVEGTFGFGSHWYISDIHDRHIFDQGQLCSKKKGECDICLGDGSYTFRVTGPAYNETQERVWVNKLKQTEPNYTIADGHSALNVFRGHHNWRFCHTEGFFNDQLKFHVLKCKCIPDLYEWADEVCDGLEAEALVVVVGVVALGGVDSELFNGNKEYMKSAIASSVTGWDASAVSIISTSVDAREVSSGNRVLSETFDVQFSVSFSAKSFGVDGTVYYNVENLVSDMSSTMATALSSGQFATQLKAGASLANEEVFAETVSASLLSLEVSAITYSGVGTSGEQLVYYYDTVEDTVVDGSSSSSSNPFNMVTMAAAVAVVAVIAVVGIFSHNKSKYSQLPVQSEHFEVSVHDSKSSAAENDQVTQSFISSKTDRVVEMEYKRALPGAHTTVAF